MCGGGNFKCRWRGGAYRPSPAVPAPAGHFPNIKNMACAEVFSVSCWQFSVSCWHWTFQCREVLSAAPTLHHEHCTLPSPSPAAAAIAPTYMHDHNYALRHPLPPRSICCGCCCPYTIAAHFPCPPPLSIVEMAFAPANNTTVRPPPLLQRGLYFLRDDHGQAALPRHEGEGAGGRVYGVGGWVGGGVALPGHEGEGE